MSIRPDENGSFDDRSIRDGFRALREEDRRNVPDFHRLIAAPRRPAPWAARFASGAAALAAAAALLVAAFALRPTHVPSGGSHDDAMALARSFDGWTAPTDDLLEIDEVEIPRGVPTLTFSSLALPESGAGADDNGRGSNGT